MYSEWMEQTIDSICTQVTSGGTPSRKIPGNFVSPGQGGVSWLKTKELDDRAIRETEEHITAEAIRSSSAKILPHGTVVMAMYGATAGRLGLLSEPMTCNQAVCAMVVDDEKADHRFLFYSLLNHRSAIVNLAVGSAQQNLSGQVIKKLRLPFPSLGEQRRIAGVLGALDDLIEVNRRLMGDLDELGMSLFGRAWDGTSWTSVASLGQVTMGQSPSGSTLNEEGRGMVFFQGVRDFGDRYPTARVHCPVPNRVADEGDILIAVRAPIGDTNLAVEKTGIGRGLAALKAHQPALALRALRASKRTWAAHEGTGTVFASISGPDLRNAQVPLVGNQALELQLQALDRMHRALADENAELATTRDELLPLLMSGRVRVAEVAA